ncbi:MAG: DUF3300 domain-containing protein [Deltaproteobacteria bacterium]|nr:DUF3300 domain-containing protein [Deltaproteobacteria bacterium]
MKKISLSIRVLYWVLMVMLAVPVVASGQAAPPPVYSKAELAQMLAPVALYPDALLIQVLMAATYPIEVQEAAIWVAQNPTLRDAQLDAALLAVGWDVSVKSLAHVPNILQMMNEKIEWTSGLGNAFLVQQGEVMDTVQELRVKAQAAGYLKTSNQQKVIVEQRIIRIEPPAPEVVYVPVYNPVVVYGPWMYPAYPPPPVMYVSPGVPVVAGVVGFTAGFMVGAAVNSWATPHWGRHEVNINVTKTVNYNVVNVHDRSPRWEHNPIHRHDIPYHNPDTARRYGGKFDPHPVPLKPALSGPTGPRPGFGPTGPKPGLTGPTGFTPGKPGVTPPKPGMTSPTMPKPGMTSPTSPKPGMTSPTMPKPGMTSPTSPKPGMTSPTMPKPGMTSPTSPKPGMTSPTSPKPGMTNPTSPKPGTAPKGFTPGQTGASGATKSRSTQFGSPSGATTSRSVQTNRPSGATASRPVQTNRPSGATASRPVQTNRPSGAAASRPAQTSRPPGAAAPRPAPPRPAAPPGQSGKDPRKH